MKSFIFLISATLLITSCASKRPQQTTAPQQIAPTPIIFSWPTQGKVVRGFDGGTNKGIDIAGNLGSPIQASASGRVVFANNTLKGYGNLIIIKHDSNYLTAYAHNRILLVKEGDFVNKGQKIAEMGDSDTNMVKLHFEIRQNGISVDPIPFLSQSNSGVITQPKDSQPMLPNLSGDIDAAKSKCKSLGFKEQTEAFGKCVIRLSK